MLDSADPLQGWPIDEIIRKAPLAKNDMYGSLFFYLQDILWRFCHQISRLKLSIQLSQVDALKLPSIVEQYKMGQSSFDRIEVRFPKWIPYFAYRFCSLDDCVRLHLTKIASLDYSAVRNWPLIFCSFQTSRTVVISGLRLPLLPLARCSNVKPRTRVSLSWYYFSTQFMKCILH